MLKKHMKIVVAAACAFVLVAGAATFFIVRGMRSLSHDAVYSDGCNFSGPDGFIHQQPGQNSAFMFFDYKKKENGYLWGGAAASSFDKYPTVVAKYGGNIYAIAPYGANKSFIYKADREGKQKETLIEADSDAGGRMIIMSGKLYFENTVHKVENLTATDETTVSINSVDLKTKKLSTVSPRHTGKNASISLLGCYKDNLYYIYSSQSEVSGEETVKNKHAIYELNLKTGAEKAILGQLGTMTALKFYGDSAYYMLTDPDTEQVTLCRHHLDTGADEKIASGKNIINSIQCFDGKVFYRVGKTNTSEGYYYDLKKKVTKSVPVKYGSNQNFYIVGESNDLFIIICWGTGNGGQAQNGTYAYIKKADYYAGKVQPVKFK